MNDSAMTARECVRRIALVSAYKPRPMITTYIAECSGELIFEWRDDTGQGGIHRAAVRVLQ